MHLTPRLEMIAKQVTKDAIVADIGTDHAYIPIYLVDQKITTKLYACDISSGPLNSAKKQIEKSGYQNEIITLLGEGLEPIKDLDVENIIIAGMGGILIKEIIENNKKTALSASKLILQAMTAQEDLRRYLTTNGFTICHEELAKEDRRIYQLIVAKQGNSISYDEIDFHIGPKLLERKDPLLIGLIDAKERELSNIVNACGKEASKGAMKKATECKELMRKLMEVRKCL